MPFSSYVMSFVGFAGAHEPVPGFWQFCTRLYVWPAQAADLPLHTSNVVEEKRKVPYIILIHYCCLKSFNTLDCLQDLNFWLCHFTAATALSAKLRLQNPHKKACSEYYHHVMLLAQISLTLSRHFSLSFIDSGRSSGLYLVSSHSCCMYVRADRPAFAQPYVGGP